MLCKIAWDKKIEKFKFPNNAIFYHVAKRYPIQLRYLYGIFKHMSVATFKFFHINIQKGTSITLYFNRTANYISKFEEFWNIWNGQKLWTWYSLKHRILPLNQFVTPLALLLKGVSDKRRPVLKKHLIRPFHIRKIYFICYKMVQLIAFCSADSCSCE